MISPLSIRRLALAAAILFPARSATADNALRQLNPTRVPATVNAGPEKGPADALAMLKARIEKGNEARPLFQVTEGEIEGKKKHYLVVPLGKLDRPFLFQGTIEKGPGVGFIVSTLIDDTFLISFVKAGEDKIQIWRRQTDVRASDGTPELRAIERTVQDYFLGQVDIKASDKAQGYVVVSADELFVRDATMVGLRLQGDSDGKVIAFSERNSILLGIKSFPKNLDARVQLAYDVSDPRRAARLDESTVIVVMRYSITALPEDPSFTPRPADERVGYFTTSFRDLSRPDPKKANDTLVHYINRWNLQKKEPDAPVSEVKEPIVFWLEDTIPEEYRPAIRQGILAWNAAFEAAGLKGALIVKQVPAPGRGNEDMSAEARASFDPADISYNLVRWYVGGFGGAVGPSRANPLTGQIFHAVISMSDVLVRSAYELDLTPPKEAGKDSKGAREAASERLARREAALARAMAELRLPGGDAERARLIQEALFETTAHEVGHTLGLEHNFKASQYLTQQELGKDGLYSASVMDYNPAYLAPPGREQGRYFQDRVGPYDRWAIEYGYKPSAGDAKAALAELKAIAGRANTDPALAFGNDGDVPSDLDTRQFDMGKGALPFAKSRVELAQHLWRELAAAPVRPDEDNSRLRQRFAAGFGAYFTASEAALPLVGGWRSRRGPGRQFEPVPASEQREALAFLEQNVLSSKPFQVSPDLLQRLGNDRLAGHGNRRFQMDGWVGALQGNVLSTLISPGTLSNLAANEVNAGPEGRLSSSELFDRVRRAVWSDLAGGKPIDFHRRSLQETHARVLAETMKEPSVPTEARAAARRDLERIVRDAKKALAGRKLDQTTRLHLDEIVRTARESLDADGKRR